jgi:predicted GH43/DUF377 family glycosyl hydrolase
MTDFIVKAAESMTLHRKGRLKTMYVLSPFVWQEGATFHLLVRAVPSRDDEPRLKMAEIWYGRSDDGLHFEMDEGPVIFPGPGAHDLDGCEDPTVVKMGDRYGVWYTGWNQAELTGRLLFADGPTPRHLEKRGVALDSFAPVQNPKEATVVRAGAGVYKLFFEFARDGASAIGLAESDAADGPWTCRDLELPARPALWDSWHLSTGPIVGVGTDRPLMFYNGASHDAHWRIGWVAFDQDLTRIIDRSVDPVITPEKLKAGWTDIAFAAGARRSGSTILSPTETFSGRGSTRRDATSRRSARRSSSRRSSSWPNDVSW